jgi:exosome complex component RRP41
VVLLNGDGVKLIGPDGLRLDGRKDDELRPLRIDAGVLRNADGSALVEWGKNKVLAAVYGPREARPRHMQNPTRANVNVVYNMAAFSVEDRVRPGGPGRRSIEISKIVGEALAHVVFAEQFPRASIDVYVEVLQASAGTRCAGLVASSVALADAGIPMMDLVPACAAGKVGGRVVLDLSKEEDNFGQADLPVALVPKTGEIVLLQMDGHMTPDEFELAVGMASSACAKIHELQRDALRRRYAAEAMAPAEGEADQ